jgi:torulene dioxygenase
VQFDNDYEKHNPVALTVKGNIPAYAAGVLYRTGPMGYKIKTDKGDVWSARHWFDGLSCVHRFQIDAAEDGNVEVKYSSRRTVDEYLEIVRTAGKLDGITFGAKRDPCKSIFAKFFTMFAAQRNTKNVGVTLSINMPGGGYVKGVDKEASTSDGNANGIQTLHAKTDNHVVKKIDPETLEPVGIAMQKELHPDLKGALSASHAKTDPETGDLFNFNLEPGFNSTYRVFCTSASTGKTSILATFQAKPAYLHSLFLSKSYVILCVWNSHITWGGVSVLYNKNIAESIAPLDKSSKAVWYIVDRLHGKGLVATYESDPFFCFHTVNAWEEPSADDSSKTDIIAEAAIYDNTDVIHRFYYDNLISSEKEDPKFAGKDRAGARPHQAQFRLPSVDSVPSPTTRCRAELLFKADQMISMELPVINPAYLTRRHRYTYGNSDRLKSSFLDGIVKFDNVTQTARQWETEGHTPSEPIFIADPEGLKEDDGVLLSVVLDGFRGKSYLLCLDARDLGERGRAELDGPVAFTFHGAHKANGRVYGGDI